MFRKLGVAGLVAGAALGVLISAAPAQAGTVSTQAHQHEEDGFSEAVSFSVNEETNVNADVADSTEEENGGNDVPLPPEI